MAGSAPLWSGAMSPSTRLLFSAVARCSLQPGPVLAAQVAHALLPSPLPLTLLLPLFSFIHPIPFLFLEERELLGKLRYLAGIRCELGKTALPWSQCLAPCAGPLGPGPQVQAPQVWVSRCGVPWCCPPRCRPPGASPPVQAPTCGSPGVAPPAQAAPEQALGNAFTRLRELSGPLCLESGGGLGCLHGGVG